MIKSSFNTGSIELNEINNYYIFKYNGVDFKILKIDNTNKHYVFIHQNSANDVWLNRLNHYSILKNPSIEKLLEKFNKIAKKYFINNTVVKIDNIFDNKNDDILFEKEENYFKKLIHNVENHGISHEAKSLLIREYITLFKHFKNKNYGSISIFNNNPYEWDINFINFNSNKLNEELLLLNKKSSYNYINVKFIIDKINYPNIPPKIKVYKPHLSNSLSMRLANTKILSLDYWIPNTSYIKIIDHIYNILDNFASINLKLESNLEDNELKNYLKIQDILCNLSSITSVNYIDEIDKNLNLKKISDFCVNTNNTDKNNNFWKSGTGYGHKGLSSWDPEEYTKLQEERNNVILDIFSQLLTCIQNIELSPQIIKLLENSIIVKYLIDQLEMASFMHISKNFITYKIYFEIIKLFAQKDSIYLLKMDVNNRNLHDIIIKIYKYAVDSLQLDDTNETALVIYELWTMIYNNYNYILDSSSEDKEPKTEQQISTKESEYIKSMSKYKIKYCIFSDSEYYYTKKINSEDNYKHCFKRLSSEIPTLSDSLPIDYNATICVAIDKAQPNKQQYLITGPIDTPYQNGCFIFDAFMSSDFPKIPPDFWFKNTGGNRLSPNLYDSGKVCISILNTYIGPSPDKSELWIPKESTLYQVVISILGQILIEEPYFCEPGYESSINTKYGREASIKYNFNIRLYTMQSTIRDFLVDPNIYSQFKEIIIEHFKLKKDDILKQCGEWVNEFENTQFKDQIVKYSEKLEKYKKTFEQIKEAYQKDTFT